MPQASTRSLLLQTSHSTRRSAPRWFHNFSDRTWHFTWAGSEENCVTAACWHTPGGYPWSNWGTVAVSTKLGKVCKYDLMQKSRKQLEVNYLNLKRAVRVNNHSCSSSSRGKQGKAGTKSKLALCVCSDVKFCYILVPLPPLAASVSQRIKLQSSARGVFVHHCHSVCFLLWEGFDRPAVASMHSGIDYYCLKSSTPIDRLSVGTAFSFW